MTFAAKIGLGIAAVIGLAVTFPVVEHYRAKASARAYRQQLEARGEKLSVAANTPPISFDDLKGSRALLNAITTLRGGQVSYFVSPPSMRTIAPGHVLVSWTQEIFSTTDSSNLWPELSAQIHEAEPGLAELRAVLQNPAPNFQGDSKSGVLMLPHLAPLRQAAGWLFRATMLELHEGHPAAAWDELKACTAMTRFFQHEPWEISQLVRVNINQTVLGATWQALQYPGWNDAQLAALQNEWDSIGIFNEAENSMQMERAMTLSYFDLYRNSFTNINAVAATGVGGGKISLDDVGEALADPKEAYRSFMNRYPRYWTWKWWESYEEEVSIMEQYQASLEMIRLVNTTHAFVPALKQMDKNYQEILLRHTNTMDRFYFGMSQGTVTLALTRLADMEMERRMVVTAIALRRFQLRAGKYPEALKELIPDYLAEMPIDFMDGKPLRYHSKSDGSYVLYSVGEDGEDNGGDMFLGELFDGRFKGWWLGRDAVWPMPATTEEAQAYEKDELKRWQDRHLLLQSTRTRGRSPGNP